GILGIHALLVRQQEWEWLYELGGCDFDSDSLFLPAKVLVDPGAMDHPAVKGWGESFTYSADWTNHTKSVTGLPGVQVLLRVDESTYEPVRPLFIERGGKPMGDDHPIAWTREWQGGRFFYTEFGHDVRSLDTKFGRQHLLAGIKWAAGEEEGD
ncbi:MAG: ThuA domain-containing protein, partial [Verrucomicrobiota bacterium]